MIKPVSIMSCFQSVRAHSCKLPRKDRNISWFCPTIPDFFPASSVSFLVGLCSDICSRPFFSIKTAKRMRGVFLFLRPTTLQGATQSYFWLPLPIMVPPTSHGWQRPTQDKARSNDCISLVGHAAALLFYSQ